MIWAWMLSYITWTVDQELQLRNKYLTAENLDLLTDGIPNRTSSDRSLAT
jgi:hypothetical protein